MRVVATSKSEQTEAAVDPWTMVHLSMGLAMGLMEVPLRWALAGSIVYEMVEQVFERQDWGQAFFETAAPESLPNAVVDSAVFLLGHRLGQLWNRS